MMKIKTNLPEADHSKPWQDFFLCRRTTCTYWHIATAQLDQNPESQILTHRQILGTLCFTVSCSYHAALELGCVTTSEATGSLDCYVKR